MVQRGDHTLGHTKHQQNTPQRRPVNLGPKPEYPEDPAAHSRQCLEEVSLTFTEQDSTQECRNDEDHRPSERGRQPTLPRCVCDDQQEGRNRSTCGRHQQATCARVQHEYTRRQSKTQTRAPQRLSLLKEQRMLSLKVHRHSQVSAHPT